MDNLAVIDLITKEGWTIKSKGRLKVVEVYGEEFPLVHPAAIHLKIYRISQNPDIKYQHLKAAHDYLWPDQVITWNYWTERRFRAHCEDWRCITYAGGAACGKSYDAAKLAILFWLADPKKRAVLVMSTTMESLNSRIYGYCTRLITELSVGFPYKLYRGNNPRIGFPDAPDNVHSIAAVAAKKGDSDAAISSLIGRHPTRGLMVIGDECTDLPAAILSALPNLSSGVEFFQFTGIGNSLSKFDLHGALSTPKDGWRSIDPMQVNKWETTQEKGLCLLFSCYESPAIHEPDPIKKAALEKFLITQDEITAKGKLYGFNSDSFYRFVLGFWRSDSVDETVLSRKFLDEFHVQRFAEWSGVYPLQVVAGLDPAFTQGGDQCVLRLAVLGQMIDGRIVLDFRGEELIFKIRIKARDAKSAELQIADQVLEILNKYGCRIGNMCIDATGQGRALGEVIKLRANSLESPIKIYSVRQGSGAAQKSFDIQVRTNFELWTEFRNFIQTDQLRGLDNTTIGQLTSRLIEVKAGKQVLETKSQFKQRMGAISPSFAHSPDEADAAALALQAAILKFGFTPGQKRDLKHSETFEMEKFYAFKLAKEVEERHIGAPPVADFSEDVHNLGELKTGFSDE